MHRQVEQITFFFLQNNSLTAFANLAGATELTGSTPTEESAEGLYMYITNH